MLAGTRFYWQYFNKLAVVTLLLCIAASSAMAAPITYTFSGPVSGTLGATLFTNAQITITATGDTSTIPDLIDCGGPPIICNTLSSVTFTINGVGSGTITTVLFIFDFGPNQALGLERPNAGGDWVDISHPQFATYLLATSIGPLTVARIGNSPFGSVATTAGTLSLTSNPNTFQAVTAAVGPPTIAKSFGAASIPLNGSTSLSFTITNPNAGSALTGVGFIDTLPAGLIVSTPNGLTGSCGGGTITATAGSGSVSLAGATLAGSASCTFSVNVTGTTAGTKVNTTSTVASVEGGPGAAASATVTVAAVGPPPATIPTLQQWAVSVLALLLIATAGVTLRRRKRG